MIEESAAVAANRKFKSIEVLTLLRPSKEKFLSVLPHVYLSHQRVGSVSKVPTALLTKRAFYALLEWPRISTRDKLVRRAMTRVNESGTITKKKCLVVN